MTNPYDDIINLPHHQSLTRPHMSAYDRAAQFSPFAALTGYEDAVAETARQTDKRFYLMDHVLNLMTDRPQILAGEKSIYPWILTVQILMGQILNVQILAVELMPLISLHSVDKC